MANTTKFQFRFVGTDEWIDSAAHTAEAAAIGAMRAYGGRIGNGVRYLKDYDLWQPRARARRSASVQVREV